jgi:hypothetical protein
MPSTIKYIRKEKVFSMKPSAVSARKWRVENPDACSAYGCSRPKIKNKSLCSYHKEVVYDRNMKSKAKRKLEVLTHYSPNHILKCSWEKCLISDIDMLSLDHMNNNGAEDRRKNAGGSGDALYRQVKREGFPEGFQTLCFNHQMKKERLLQRCYKAKKKE